MQTRRNLLSVKENNENMKPSLQQIVGELKDATFSGALLKNAMQLTEKAADSAFGPMEMPKDASLFRRTYALGTRTVNGVRQIANDQINKVTQQARDMTSNRMDNTRGMIMQRANQVQESVMPIAQRIGATPVVPNFLVRMLRQPEQQPAMQEKQPQQPQMLPATTIRVDIVGTKPEDAPQATSTSKPDSSMPKGTNSSSTTVKASTTTDSNMGSTGVQSSGSIGEAGKNTTTGSETNTTTDSSEQSGEGGKQKHKKHSNKL
jgi:hypothetical protein